MLGDEARVSDEGRLDAAAEARELTEEERTDQQRLEDKQRGRDERIGGQTAGERGSRLRDVVSMSDAYRPGGGCQSSMRLPSGSVIQPKRPSAVSATRSSTVTPSRRRAASTASRSATR